MCGILDTFLTGSLRFWKYTKIVLLNTSFMEKNIDYGNWLHNRLFVHGQTKTHYDLVRFCIQNVNKGVLYIDIQIEELC